MTSGKRILDLSLALLLALFLAPLIAGVALAVLLLDGRPVFYVSDRVARPGQVFRLIKFRTMRPDRSASGVCGGPMQPRITRLGHRLRRSRLDELPQLWNIARGEMSFVGPRPPLPSYATAYPELYASVLRHGPGLTGLGTLLMLDREAALLARCRSVEETDRIYRRRCLTAKARLDLIYLNRRSLRLDLLLLCATVIHLSPLPWRVTPGLGFARCDKGGAFAPTRLHGRARGSPRTTSSRSAGGG